MTNPVNHRALADGIEALVRQYISTIQVTTQAAVERALAANSGSAVAARTAGRRPRGAPGASASRQQGSRRPSEEIGALSERFYEALCRAPGEKMAVLAPMVGATAPELNRPMLLLKRAGRIRSVGTKHATRYFPMAPQAPRPSA